MEKFLNKKVEIRTCLGSIYSSVGVEYNGTVTSFDDEYVCLDNNLYVVRKYILSIKVK